MKHIIVPIDFSENSKNALENACAVADKLDMGLILTHALSLPVGFTSANFIGPGFESLQKMRQSSADKLTQLTKDLSQYEHLKMKVFVGYGTVDQVLGRIIKKHDVSMVIMSSKGSQNFVESLIGTNSYHVMKHVDCPVIVLPEGSDIKTMKHIALAGDYAETSNPDLLEHLMTISRAFFAHIHVVHIEENKVLEDDQIDIARGIQRYLGDSSHSFHFETYENIEKGLLDFCQQHAIDLLAMIPRQYSMLEKLFTGSETKNMLDDISIPLLVLQD